MSFHCLTDLSRTHHLIISSRRPLFIVYILPLYKSIQIVYHFPLVCMILAATAVRPKFASGLSRFLLPWL